MDPWSMDPLFGPGTGSMDPHFLFYFFSIFLFDFLFSVFFYLSFFFFFLTKKKKEN